jgi:hypothetical protein
MSDAVAVPPEEAVAEEPQVPTRRLLVFEVSGNGYACDMDVFRESPQSGDDETPGAPNTVCGLMTPGNDRDGDDGGNAPSRTLQAARGIDPAGRLSGR